MSAVAAPQRAGKRSGHREDIHGLRGLGILLVVAYHLWTSGRVSGGVDIFLIISAYLMTGSMVRKGRAFRVVSFLIQRFRRLVPQAAIVIAATLAFGWFFLPPVRHIGLFLHAQSSLFYVENWTLIEQAVNYTAVDAGAVSPFQHFWSLSIQGQVFVIWPLLFLAGVFIASALRARMRLVLAVLFAAVTVASFSYAQEAIDRNPAEAYFDTFARVWEFSLAGLLALVPRLALPRWLVIPIGWAGLAAVLGAGIIVGRENFPGPAALMPALGAAAIMIAPLDSSDRRDIAWWLSRRPITFVANRAYAIYLWHWPVYVYWLSLTETDASRLDPLGSAVVLGISFVLADLSTRAVERRFHRLEVLSSKRGALSAIAAFVIIVVGLVEGLTGALNREAERAQAEDRPGARAVLAGDPPPPVPPTPTPLRGAAPGDGVVGDDWPSAMPRCADLDPMPPTGGGCHEVKPPPEGATQTVVLIGDSHAYQWSTALVPMARDRGWHLIMPMLPNCRVTLENPWSNTVCLEYSQEIVDYLLQTRPDVVVTVSSRGQSIGPELEVETYADAIRPVVEAGIRVVNLRDNPRWPFHMPECVQRFGVDSERCSAPRSDKLNDVWPREALQGLPNMAYLDFTDLICPLERCRGVVGGVYVYMDGHHLSAAYIRTMNEEFAVRWDQALGS
ncbi:MAG: acyltransferase family protein [Propionibacteriaceae bacterium]|nr:acyltransferase family protein [Propionibacteriaceae bacterium]